MGSFIKAPSTLFLIFANLITIVFAVYYQWNVITLLWIYWCQSVIIGFFNFLRILALKDFSTAGFKINGRQPAPTQVTKIFTAFFFAFHYGLFHLVYAMFLLGFSFFGFLSKVSASGATFSMNGTGQEIGFILGGALLFFFAHLVSFLFYLNKPNPQHNIGTIMFYPYARIIPMHLTIIFGAPFLGAGSAVLLVFFLLLKTIADAAMQFVEHREQL